METSATFASPLSARSSIPGVSNLFDRRAKCTNFKLVGGQIEMPKVSRRKGMGLVSSPSGVQGYRKRVLAYFTA